MASRINLATVPYYEICIDESTHEDISGRMYCGMKPKGFCFKGSEELLLEMENIMDHIKFPEAAMESRSFAAKNSPQRLPLSTILESQKEMRRFYPNSNVGKKATVLVQIQFRQNANWQGQANWLEKEECFQFESEMEFFRGLDRIANKY